MILPESSSSNMSYFRGSLRAHLRNAALKNASTLAGQIIEQATNSNVIEIHKEKKHK
jgi:hypothetical protein